MPQGNSNMFFVFFLIFTITINIWFWIPIFNIRKVFLVQKILIIRQISQRRGRSTQTVYTINAQNVFKRWWRMALKTHSKWKTSSPLSGLKCSLLSFTQSQPTHLYHLILFFLFKILDGYAIQGSFLGQRNCSKFDCGYGCTTLWI